MVILSSKGDPIKNIDGHTEYRNKNGEVVPSVTTILKIIAKESLIKWANNLGWNRKSVTKELDDASYIGTYVHNYIEAVLLKDEEKAYNIKKYVENTYNNPLVVAINYGIESFDKWWEINKDDVEVVEVEKEMACDRYGGTCDLICKYKGRLCVIDFKTSSSFYFTMYLQLAAYYNLYFETTGDKLDTAAILRLDKKHGNIAEIKFIEEVPNGDLDYYYIIFNRIVDLYEPITKLDELWNNQRSK